MRHMAIEEQRTSSVAMRVSNRAVAEERAVVAEPVVPVALVELAVQEARVALVALAEPVAQVVREALAEPVAQVAVAQALVPAVAELERAPAVEVPERDPVVEEPELVQVAVVLELDPAAVVPELDPAAVPLKTKSVIGARHRDLAPLRAAEEDLAAGAETTRDPAATEAGTAWVAAV
jgi:hypothetical protein